MNPLQLTHSLLPFHLQCCLSLPFSHAAVDGTIKALVLVPTRELVEQAADAVDALIHFMRDACSMLALGGAPMETQKAQLRSPPDVLIATPGRLVSHLKQGMCGEPNVSRSQWLMVALC